jgi:hypothetical protein
MFSCVNFASLTHSVDRATSLKVLYKNIVGHSSSSVFLLLSTFFTVIFIFLLAFHDSQGQKRKNIFKRNSAWMFGSSVSGYIN